MIFNSSFEGLREYRTLQYIRSSRLPRFHLGKAKRSLYTGGGFAGQEADLQSYEVVFRVWLSPVQKTLRLPCPEALDIRPLPSSGHSSTARGQSTQSSFAVWTRSWKIRSFSAFDFLVSRVGRNFSDCNRDDKKDQGSASDSHVSVSLSN